MKKIIPSTVIIALIFSTCFAHSILETHKEKEEAIIDNDISVEVKTEKRLPEPCTHEKVIHVKRQSPTFNKPGHIEYYYCYDCLKSFSDEECQNPIENSNYGIKDKRDARYIAPLTRNISILNKNVRRYLDAKTDKDILDALSVNKTDNKPLNDQQGYTIYWEDTGHAPYSIEVSKTRNFATSSTFVSDINSFTFERALTPGDKYYYRVMDSAYNLLLDDLSFEVDDTYSLRTIYLEGVTNVRDTGGWSTIEGKKVKYGMVYRGGRLTSISDYSIETLLDTLGVKTELDLRKPAYGGEPELIDGRLTYENCGMWFYNRIMPGRGYDDGHHQEPYDPPSLEAIKKIMHILADENNYPVYYHCISGADRTGTVAYLINGLLGVSYEDLTKDFELTSFSTQGARYRDEVATDGQSFVGEGSSGVYSTAPYCAWALMHRCMMEDYGTGDGKLSSAIEKYLLNVCEVPQGDIDSIRSILLED